MFKQGSESDFCFGKENSGPGSEPLLCQAQRGVWLGDPVDRCFWGVAKGCQHCHATGPEFLSSAWVSQLPTLLAGQRGVWRGLAPRNSLLPVSFPWTSTCSEEGAERTERGLASNENWPAFSGEVRWGRQHSSYRNGESRERTPAAKQGASQASFFAPPVGIGYPTGITGCIRHSGPEDSGGGKGTWYRTEAHTPPSPSLPPPRALGCTIHLCQAHVIVR